MDVARITIERHGEESQHLIYVEDFPKAYTEPVVMNLGTRLQYLGGRVQCENLKFWAVADDTEWLQDWIAEFNAELVAYVSPLKRNMVLQCELHGRELTYQLNGVFPASWQVHAEYDGMRYGAELSFDSLQLHEESANLYRRRLLLETMDFPRKHFWD